MGNAHNLVLLLLGIATGLITAGVMQFVGVPATAIILVSGVLAITALVLTTILVVGHPDANAPTIPSWLETVLYCLGAAMGAALSILWVATTPL